MVGTLKKGIAVEREKVGIKLGGSQERRKLRVGGKET